MALTMMEHGRRHAAARLLLSDNSSQARACLDGLRPQGPHGCILAERLRFGPPETWHGWLRGYGAVSVKLWPETEPPPPAIIAVAAPGLAPLLSAGPHWRVFGWIPGTRLSRLLRGPSDLDGPRILVEVTTAVTALHQAGQAHGDLTPANVVITPDGGATVIDWGELVAGTPGWNPDRGETPIERDLWALAQLERLLAR